MSEDILNGGLETLCLEFEAAIKGESGPSIEQYLERAPDDSRGKVLLELLLIEFRSLGTLIDPSVYEMRFPAYTQVVGAAIKLLEDQATVDQRTTFSDALAEAKVARPSLDSPPPATGTTPAQIGRYQVIRLLGSGGFGEVYLGQDPDLPRQVAIKVPRNSRRWTTGDQQKFLEEARKMVALQGPGIATVYDIFQEQVAGHTTVCIVQEYIEGRNLALWRRERPRPLDPEPIARLVAEIALILAPAHRKGLIHRDLKPANILVHDKTGKPHVLDFGLALDDGQRFQRVGAVEGTRPYMAPEQTRGETHRMDGRTDIWSLGVILYELLTGRRPFSSSRHDELLFAIQHGTPHPLRMIDEQIPRELERVCLKCLSKSMADRYTTVTDLASELLEWRQTRPNGAAGTLLTMAGNGQSASGVAATAAVRDSAGTATVIPRGIRSFSEDDGDFFLELLPGVRERNGLPESIDFWKRRIESTAPDLQVPVGLVCGPSGCGKSSLIRAGLLPRLDGRVVTLYLEATRSTTERQLLGRLRQLFPEMPLDGTLRESFASLREGNWLAPGNKLLIVIDQFEQWLYAHKHDVATELCDALRQCDGYRLQAIVLVRDDYWTPASDFFRALDFQLAEKRNCQQVSLFDIAHARKVLTLFGQAYGTLPSGQASLAPEHEAFLDLALETLAEDGKVISVRLAIFAELMKGRRWVPETVEQLGGVPGVGKSFLEQAFAARDASPIRKRHAAAAQRALRALLPPPGVNIKGHGRSEEELSAAAGYADRPGDYAELIKILDEDLRLITPAFDDERQRVGYQLTHDYLVASLRDWIAGKLRESWSGRAELLMEERFAAWQAKPENRHLPSLWEALLIAAFTRGRQWTPAQRSMTSLAIRRHAVRVGIGTLVAISIISVGTYIRVDAARRQEAILATGLVSELVSAAPAQIPAVIAKIPLDAELAVSGLNQMLEADPDSEDGRRKKLHAQMGLVSRDPKLVDPLFDQLLDGELAYVAPICEVLRPYAAHTVLRSRQVLNNEKASSLHRFRAALVLASHAPLASDSDWSAPHRPFVVDELVSFNQEQQPDLRRMLRPLSKLLLPELERVFKDETKEDALRDSAAKAIADFGVVGNEQLTQLLTYATPAQFEVLFPLIRSPHPGEIIESLRLIAGTLPPELYGSEERITYGRRRANAAIALLRLREHASALSVFEMADDPEALTQFVFRCRDYKVEVEALLECLDKVRQDGHASHPKNARYGLMMAIGEYEKSKIPEDRQRTIETQLCEWYKNDPSSGVHGAAGWLLRQWGRGEYVKQIDQTRRDYSPDFEWFTVPVPSGGSNQNEVRLALQEVLRKSLLKYFAPSAPPENPSSDTESKNRVFYYTFVVFPAGDYTVGSPNDEPERQRVEERHVIRQERPFALLNREITMDEMCALPLPAGEAGFDYEASTNNRGLDRGSAAGAVSWYDAVRYCRWLGRQRGIKDQDQPYADPSQASTGPKESDPKGSWAPRDWKLDLSLRGFRLPTEAEWETAGRGGALTAYAFGGDAAHLRHFDWCGETGNGPNHKPQQKRPNLRGLFDMHGNVSEWCHDWFEEKIGVQSFSVEGEPEAGLVRSIRGGTIAFNALNARVGRRSCSEPITRLKTLGFRIAMTIVDNDKEPRTGTGPVEAVPE